MQTKKLESVKNAMFTVQTLKKVTGGMPGTGWCLSDEKQKVGGVWKYVKIVD